MPSTPIAGFITKIEAAEQYQRSHRQLSRDLSDAMKLQNPKVLENCRLHTEDGRLVAGMGVTPETIDQLCIQGKNPTWYLSTTWLEKKYGRRDNASRSERPRPDTDITGEVKTSTTESRPALEQILRDRIHDLERDKKDLKEELKIKNQQIAERVQLEKQTNELVRNLHTLMADLQGRLLPAPSQRSDHLPTGSIDNGSKTTQAAHPTSEPAPSTVEVSPSTTETKKKTRRPAGHRRSKKKRSVKKRGAAKRTTDTRKPTSKQTPAGDTSTPTKRRGLWSRLLHR